MSPCTEGGAGPGFAQELLAPGTEGQPAHLAQTGEAKPCGGEMQVTQGPGGRDLPLTVNPPAPIPTPQPPRAFF